MNINMGMLQRGAAVALVAVAVAACGSDSNKGGQGPSGGGPVITIKDFGYGSALTVAPGATVTVKQEDTVQHDVSSSAFKTKLLSKGESTSFTAPSQPGTYDYTCSIHPRMHGQLIVQAGGSGSAAGDGGMPGGY